MILWAKQAGWIAAKKERAAAELPPVAYDYPCQVLLGAGPVEYIGMGDAVGISPQRLESWCRLTAWPLTPWEAETVLDMSKAYANARNDEKAPMPWQPETVDKAALGSAIERVFAAVPRG